MLAIVDIHNAIHIQQGDNHKDTLPGDYLQESEAATSITEYKKGLLISGNAGSLVFFYPVDSWHDSKHLYVQYRSLKANSGICSVAVSLAEDLITVVLQSGHLGILDLEDLKAKQEMAECPVLQSHVTVMTPQDPFAMRCGSFSHEAFVDVDICMASCCFGAISKEALFVLWNYETKTCLMKQQLPQETYCLSLHPSGTLVLFGMRDKLRIYRILLDKLVLSSEYPVKKACVAKIADGGHVFATVCRSNMIHIYHVFRDNKEPWKILKGHISPIIDLCWSASDQELLSVGSGGVCYTWDVTTGQRIASKEYVDKERAYLRAMPAMESSSVLYTGMGCIEWVRNGRLIKQIVGGSPNAAPMALANDGQILLHGTPDGGIVSWSLSREGLNENADIFQLHAQEIAALCLPHHGSLVISYDVAGVLVLSKVQHVMEGVLTDSTHKHRDHACHYVSLSMEDVLNWRSKEWELNSIVIAEKKNAAYQIMKETQALKDAVNALRMENEGLRIENAKQSRSLQELRQSEENKRRMALTEMTERHSKDMEEMESLYRKRMEVEASKLRKLEQSKDDAHFAAEEDGIRLQRKNEQETQKLVASHEVPIALTFDGRSTVQASLVKEQERYQALENENQKAVAESEEIMHQLEAENDQHIENMQRHQSEVIKRTKEDERRLKVENNIAVRGILKLKSEKVEDARTIRRLRKEIEASKGAVQEQTQIAQELQREVIERDSVISSNYHTVQALRREVQELEKHKYVLGYQAAQYREALHPKDARISKLEGELRRLDDRRSQTVDAVCDLRTRLHDKTQQATALQRELSTLRACPRTCDVESEMANAETQRMLATAERCRSQLLKRIEKVEETSKGKLREKRSENRVLLDSIADLKRRNEGLENEVEMLRKERNVRKSRPRSALGIKGETVTIQRMPVTRPGSMRVYEWGTVTQRPKTAKRRPFSASP